MTGCGLFRFRRFTRTDRHAEIWSHYEKIYTGLDFVAALSFLVGSVLFYDEALHLSATTLFVIGSAFAAPKPTVRLVRECHLAVAGLLRCDFPHESTESKYDDTL